ncbi:DNA polymerase ligase-domain-containing protein [Apiospora marii]|uniref:DNA polymerase ligase-domain-containing protein n=1 Tax=Apiospora marii TaxID=335849 RepID=UPI003130A4FF
MKTHEERGPSTNPEPKCEIAKQRGLEWSIEITGSPRDATTDSSEDDGDWGSPLAALPQSQQRQQPTPAAVEAGDAKIQDHVGYFSGVLSKATLSPFPDRTPHLSVAGYRKLYEENFGSPRGAHFIVHQHDHPVAGVHYDLRLQINETSSASWAIMYGLPGDPNSQRLMRNATETRVHCLWNHLIETASVYTGSLLIWDTGTYTVLDRKSKHAPAEDPDSQDTVSSEDEDVLKLTEQEKLHRAFQDRKIRIQLHGTRLPKNYVLNLRLTTQEDAAGRAKADRKPTTRRRRRPVVQKPKSVALTPMTSSSDNDSDSSLPSQADNTETGLSKRKRGPPKTDGGTVAEDEDAVLEPVEEAKAGISAMEKELRELEDETVRRTNAYIGATNTINSIHQTKWYLSLDREACGFVKKRRQGRIVWEPNATVGGTGQEDDQGTEQNGGDGTRTHRLRFPFYVQGSEVERSVVTGRKGADVLKDEGVVGFVPRKGWKAVLR